MTVTPGKGKKMKVAFVSNFFNHHQKPFSDAMNRKCEYRFIATSEMPAERVALGYQNVTEPYVINPQDGDGAAEYIAKADIVIIGSAPENLVAERMQKNRLIFRYSERLLKKGFEFWKYPIRYYRWHKANPSGKPIYMLCASAYTSADYAKFGLFKNRCYKWGYFPACKHYDTDILFSQKDPTEILWCGRFLDWKHPEDALYVAKRLADDGVTFKMKIIGTGETEPILKKYIAENALEGSVRILGAMPPDAVRHNMEKAGIFIFTSDRKEGWGAVLNESMNSGCAVVASHAIGAVPYLIKQGENGVVYRSGDDEGLYKSVKRLLASPDEQRRLGTAAYTTIVTDWNAENAAERLISLSEHIMSGDENPNLYASGPCSKADIMRDDWV